jgi:hypothetical protein
VFLKTQDFYIPKVTSIVIPHHFYIQAVIQALEVLRDDCEFHDKGNGGGGGWKDVHILCGI